MALRILALLTDAYGGVGGIARYNRDILAAFDASEKVRSVTALLRTNEPCTEIMPTKVSCIEGGRHKIRYSHSATRVALNDQPYELIFCGHLFTAPLAAFLSTMLRVPLWLQLHGIEAWNSPGRMVRLAAERAHLVTAVSRYTRRRFLEWAINDPSTVKVLPNTFEPRFFPGPKPGRLIERLGLENQKILLTVARLSALERYKGHDRVIAALPHVLAQHPNVMYLIVGDGDDRSRLECEADALGIAKHLRFVGLVPDDELADYYRMADVFIMPSTGEGFGIVFLEAAAAGLHVIGGNQDGSADALADGAIGVVTSPTSIAGITQELVSALANRRYTANIVDRFSRHRFDRHVDAMLESNCLLKY